MSSVQWLIRPPTLKSNRYGLQQPEPLDSSSIVYDSTSDVVHFFFFFFLRQNLVTRL